MFNNMEDLDQNNWKMKYKFESDSNWKNLGRILMLSSYDDSIEKIQLKNISTEDIFVKIIIGSNG